MLRGGEGVEIPLLFYPLSLSMFVAQSWGSKGKPTSALCPPYLQQNPASAYFPEFQWAKTKEQGDWDWRDCSYEVNWLIYLKKNRFCFSEQWFVSWVLKWKWRVFQLHSLSLFDRSKIFNLATCCDQRLLSTSTCVKNCSICTDVWTF